MPDEVIKYDKEGKRKTVNKKTATKYDGHAFDRYLAHCAQGGSIPEFCRIEKIDRGTFDDWCRKYDVQNKVKKMGKLWAEGWWMLKARENLVTQSTKECTEKFDTNLYKYYTGGRFGHTADKDAHERLDEIEERLSQSATNNQNLVSAYAEEGECELAADDNKTE